MTHIETLTNTQNKADKVLASFIRARGAEALCNASKAFNRGDFAEMALTLAPVFRDGQHGTSKGDCVLCYNGEALLCEIKYLTKKTSASEALKGTYASHYILACNDGEAITLRLVHKDRLVKRMVSGAEKITYQDNCNNGVALDLGHATITPMTEEALGRLLTDLRETLWYAEVSNDYLYTQGNGYRMQHEISMVESAIKQLRK